MQLFIIIIILFQAGKVSLKGTTEESKEQKSKEGRRKEDRKGVKQMKGGNKGREGVKE